MQINFVWWKATDDCSLGGEQRCVSYKFTDCLCICLWFGFSFEVGCNILLVSSSMSVVSWVVSLKRWGWRSKPQHPWTWPYLEVRSLQMWLVKMRSHGSQILIGRGKVVSRPEDPARGSGDARCRRTSGWWVSTSHGALQTTDAGGSEKGCSPRGFGESVALLTPWFWGSASGAVRE